MIQKAIMQYTYSTHPQSMHCTPDDDDDKGDAALLLLAGRPLLLALSLPLPAVRELIMPLLLAPLLATATRLD